MKRSYLYAPGHNARILGKAASSGADAIVLDLEDGVPRDQKDLARRAVAAWLSDRLETSDRQDLEIWVRINEVSGPVGTLTGSLPVDGSTKASNGTEWLEDLEALAPVWSAIRGIRVPKAESLEAVGWLEQRLCDLNASEELELCLLFESALGIATAQQLCAQARVTQAAFGAADFVADIGADPADPMSTYWAESLLILACRMAQIEQPIMTVYTHLEDEAGLLASSRSGKARGFFGRSVIHPKQLGPVHEVFTPSASQLEAAERVVVAAAQAAGGATTSDGDFVDEAVAKRARAQIALGKKFADSECSTVPDECRGEGEPLEFAKR